MEDAVSSGLIQWHETVSAPDGDVENIKVNHEVRRGLNFGLHPGLKEGSTSELFKVSDFLYEVSKPAVDEYKSRYYSYDAVDYFGWVVLKYRVGDFFTGHTDASHDFPRQLSLVYYINDDYEGGELEFPHLNITIKPLAGELIIFPSNYLFLHAAKKVTAGVKYSAINFIN
jgi:Rps23 Pro-64 3,4-dihydroxylase Tpa1-like proline 4-hydroxylase